MCPGVVSDEPGDCPKCGMPLEQIPPLAFGATVYTCPMHPEIEQDHPGDCPKCGMPLEATEITKAADEHARREIRDLSRKFWIGLALTLPVFLLAMLPMLPGVTLERWIPKNVSKWIELALATPVVFWAGGIFFVKGWRSFKGWNLNMFTLIAIGVGAAYFYSLVAVLAPGVFPLSFRHHGEVGLYYEAAAVFTVLVLFGQLLEAKARSRTGLDRLAGSVWRRSRRPGSLPTAANRRWPSTACKSATGCGCAPARRSRSTARSPKARATSTSR